MKPAADFDPLDCPLDPGVTLIEASAGTGKTFALTTLYLRLVTEVGIPVERLLAVTYTNAATAELRDRVRKKLRAALEVARGGTAADPTVAPLLARCPAAPAEVAGRLAAAVACFDEARVLTIHGFCHSVLREFAFASGGLFDAEPLADDTPLLAEIAADHWRRMFYPASPVAAAAARAAGLSPERLTRILREQSCHPNLAVLPAADGSAAAASAALDAAFADLRALWAGAKNEILGLLDNPQLWSQDKAKGFPPARRELLADDLGHLFAASLAPDPAAFKWLEILRPDELAELRLKKAKEPLPDHPFFGACAAFCGCRAAFCAAAVAEFAATAPATLATRCVQRGILTYDAMLERVAAALRGPVGPTLCRRLRATYAAALIDEFQDTDPRQYEIFGQLFRGGGQRLYFIGDPKQAIYSFRGADVQTYLAAAETATTTYSLRACYRPEPELLAAVNTLFGGGDPFGGTAIQYRPVRVPADHPNPPPPLTGDPRLPPIILRHLPGPAGGGQLAVKAATEAVTALVADDIRLLLATRPRLGDRPLRPGDLAVLVRTNAQAAAVQEALRAAGIRSVRQTDESVFATAEADDLHRLLAGVLEPTADRWLRTALATPLFGFDAAALSELAGSTAGWLAQVERFHQLAAVWERDGILAMLRVVLGMAGNRERIVRQAGGERRLTNYSHLAELLGRAAADRNLRGDSMVAWLARKMVDCRADGRGETEDHQLRIESDEDAVLIATVHKSKGLEYPVVFCPFLWHAASSAKFGPGVFHQNTPDRRPAYDPFATAPESAGLAAAEARQESLRLAYVAITRARNRCWLYAPEIRGPAATPLGHLLGADDSFGPALADLVDRAPALFGIDPFGATATVTAAPVTAAGTLRARMLSRPVSSLSPTTSFSAMTAAAEGRERAPEWDEAEGTEGTAAAAAATVGLFAFPRGARTGVFFHDLLRSYEFTAPATGGQVAGAFLGKHGFDPAAAGPVQQLLADLGRVELFPGVALGRVGPGDRLAETEFVFPVGQLRPETLRQAFAAAGDHYPEAVYRSLDAISFPAVDGFVQGVIDLLCRVGDRCYVIDWKSNWLGDRPDDYGPAGLGRGMLAHRYHLQYLLYTAAADLFLARHLPGYRYETHFGGVAYVFLRGVAPDHPERAIHRDRPPLGLIRELQRHR